MSISLHSLRTHAQSFLRQKQRIAHLTQLASHKARQNQARLRKVLADLHLMTCLVKCWARREYTDIPWNSLLAIVGALIYFVNPLDMVPDFVSGLGLLDDLSVIAMVLAATQNDLDRFRVWYKSSTERNEMTALSEASTNP